MKATQPKHTLPYLLHKITLKYNSLFLQKLILLEQQKVDYKRIRNYDLECEGIETIVSFFKTKEQNVMLKAFIYIRENLNNFQDKVSQINQKPHGTTRRTYLNTTFTGSQCSPIKEMYCHTIRSQVSQKGQAMTAKSQLNKTSTNLQNLLNRVRLVNSKQEGNQSFRESQKNNSKPELRENYSQYVGNIYQTPKTVQQELRHKTNPSNFDTKEVNYFNYYKSQVMSTRNSRRQFIMDKFNQIQNQLQQKIGKKQSKKPQLSTQILNEINNIKQRLRLKL